MCTLELIGDDDVKADEVAAAEAALMFENKEGLNAGDAAASSSVEGVKQKMEAEESDDVTGGKGSMEFQVDEAAGAAAEESETQAMIPSMSQETHPMS